MSFIGKGTYGSVVKKGDSAKKKFHKLSHLIQEYVAIRYLSGNQNIVDYKKVNFNTLELSMFFHEMNMRDWLQGKMEGECGKVNNKNKMILLRDILRGLAYLHELDLAHGDIKPSNILVDCDNGEISGILADLGFVSIDKYAKVERTAELYRDIYIHNHKSHDIYSLGIIMLEMFGRLRLKEQPKSYKYLHEIIRKEVKNKKIADLIVKMTLEDYTKRPDAQYLLQEIFGEEKLEVFCYDIKPLINEHNLDTKTDSKIYSWIRRYSEQLELNRGKRGYLALRRFLTKNPDVDDQDIKIYTCAMLIILSSVFSRSSSYTVSDAISDCKHYKKYDKEEVIEIIADLLDDDDIIRILLCPSHHD